MLPVLSSTSANSNNSTHNSSLKRSSSMIFRIEHLLPSSSSSNNSSTAAMEQTETAISSMETKNSNRSCPNNSRLEHSGPGVFMSQHTPKGTISECIPTVTLMSSSTMVLETEERIYCTLSNGVLCMSPSILRQIKLSEDINSYNALMELHNGQVRMRLVQDVREGEQIVAWFCEQMSILMSIPFLTLHNIQGDKRYTCHICQRNFETPHPLKLHLALSCDRNSIDILYIRLYYAVTFNQQQQMLGSTMTMPMFPIQHATSISFSTNNNFKPTTSTTTEQRYSAFKPIKSPSTATQLLPVTSAAAIFTAASSSNIATPSSTTLSTPLLSSMSTGMSFLPQMSMDLLHRPSSSSLNAAAQIEAIVSNMGASKRGHLCLYCGKCYSRKYGLKIHIRTHTGFKPLKCKFCLRPFGDPSNLNKHVRLHLQANAISMRSEVHKCHLCHKALARRRDLQRHLESRHAAEIKGSP